MTKSKLLIVTGIILAAAFSRLIPHPPNFTPIVAIALFGGAYFTNKKIAFLIPLLAMVLSDLIIGLHSLFLITYGSFLLIIGIGFWLSKRKSAIYIAEASVASSVLFFITTNFGVWAFTPLYSKTFGGLVQCYVAAIPFFQNSLLGDLFYTALFFGGFALIEKRFFDLNREVQVSAV